MLNFGVNWCRWMEACVFSSHISVLVNGSPTKEFKVERGLRQVDPLSPVLFVLVTKALTGLVKKAVEIGVFTGFKISSNLSYDIL